jgi:hypothetical protein
MRNNGTNSPLLEDIRINIKLKLSALWAAVMFCYVYGDIFTLFVPGHIQSLNDGNSGVGPTTPVNLLLFAVMMTMPSVMVFLSLALKAQVNRIVNIVMGILFTVIMILVLAMSIDEWMLFLMYMGAVEVALTCAIVWYAWKWPKLE